MLIRLFGTLTKSSIGNFGQFKFTVKLYSLKSSSLATLNQSFSTIMSTPSSNEDATTIAKRKAAYLAVDEHIKDGQVVGIGSGSTVVYAVERIAQRVLEEELKLICVPTSFQAKELIVSNGLTLSDLDVHYPVHVTIDGCDECDKDLNIIKGGGGCLLQEKIVASASSKLIIVADYTKSSTYLGEKWKKGIPLEVSQFGYKVVLDKLNRFANKASYQENESSLRLAVKKMGPVVTDNSNFIIDFAIANMFNESDKTPESVETWLKSIPGILETGLFIKMAQQVYFGMPDGTVTSRTALCKPTLYR